jgi:tRNA 2-thiouridine synthesizing protein E
MLRALVLPGNLSARRPLRRWRDRARSARGAGPRSDAAQARSARCEVTVFRGEFTMSARRRSPQGGVENGDVHGPGGPDPRVRRGAWMIIGEGQSGVASTLRVGDRELETDPEGYLYRISDWSEPVARQMAANDGVELDDNHWEVIRFLRGYYDEYGVAPAIRILTKAMARQMGREKGNTRYLYRLFPDGPAKQACRYAGLPKPTGCV